MGRSAAATSTPSGAAVHGPTHLGNLTAVRARSRRRHRSQGQDGGRQKHAPRRTQVAPDSTTSPRGRPAQLGLQRGGQLSCHAQGC